MCENEFWFDRALSASSTPEASLTENTANELSVGPAPSPMRASLADHPGIETTLLQTLISTIRILRFTQFLNLAPGSSRINDVHLRIQDCCRLHLLRSREGTLEPGHGVMAREFTLNHDARSDAQPWSSRPWRAWRRCSASKDFPNIVQDVPGRRSSRTAEEVHSLDWALDVYSFNLFHIWPATTPPARQLPDHRNPRSAAHTNDTWEPESGLYTHRRCLGTGIRSVYTPTMASTTHTTSLCLSQPHPSKTPSPDPKSSNSLPPRLNHRLFATYHKAAPYISLPLSTRFAQKPTLRTLFLGPLVSNNPAFT